jgi:hypothetical protein
MSRTFISEPDLVLKLKSGGLKRQGACPATSALTLKGSGAILSLTDLKKTAVFSILKSFSLFTG